MQWQGANATTGEAGTAPPPERWLCVCSVLEIWPRWPCRHAGGHLCVMAGLGILDQSRATQTCRDVNDAPLQSISCQPLFSVACIKSAPLLVA